MDIKIFASRISDNFFYAAQTPRGAVILIDPIDGAQAVEWTREQGGEVYAVINTHFHHDHIGGNEAVFEAFPEAELWAGSEDAEQIEAQQPRRIDRRLSGGDTLEIEGVTCQILDTPGHTAGHISALVGEHLFSGDTIFAGGVGNCSFGGDVGAMFRTFQEVIAPLPDQVIFYPGHDYALRNLSFIMSVEPSNKRAEELLEAARARNDETNFRGATRKIQLRTLGEEREYNPFFRVNEPALITHLELAHAEVFERALQASSSRAEAGFRALRELRNQW